MREFNLVESTSTKLIAKVNVNAELQMNFKTTDEGVKFGFFSRKQTVLDCIYKLFIELGINCILYKEFVLLIGMCPQKMNGIYLSTM